MFPQLIDKKYPNILISLSPFLSSNHVKIDVSNVEGKNVFSKKKKINK